MTLVGQTSGAQATITNVRLISDIGAYLQGSFFIQSQIVSNPRFEAGTKVLTLVMMRITIRMLQQQFVKRDTLLLVLLRPFKRTLSP